MFVKMILDISQDASIYGGEWLHWKGFFGTDVWQETVPNPLAPLIYIQVMQSQ